MAYLDLMMIHFVTEFSVTFLIVPHIKCLGEEKYLVETDGDEEKVSKTDIWEEGVVRLW